MTIILTAATLTAATPPHAPSLSHAPSLFVEGIVLVVLIVADLWLSVTLCYGAVCVSG